MDWLGLGGLFGKVADTVGNIIGRKKDRDESSRQFDTNIAQQEKFAKNAIQWRTEDAKKAGLHPLAALGSQGISHSPVYSNGSVSNDLGFGEIGDSVDRMLPNKEAQKQQNLSNDLTQAQIDQTKAETAKILKETASMGQSPFHSLIGSGVNGSPSAFATGMHGQASSMNPGIDIQNSFSELLPMVTPDGRATLKPNDKLSELLENEGFLSALSYSVGRFFDQDEKYLNSTNANPNKEWRTSPSLKYLFSGGVDSRYVDKNEPRTLGEKFMDILQLIDPRNREKFDKWRKNQSMKGGK